MTCGLVNRARPTAPKRRPRDRVPETFQRAFKRVRTSAQVAKPATPHTLRHCFGTHLLQPGRDFRAVQELLGRADVASTMVYTHVLQAGGSGARRPLHAVRSAW